MTGQLQWVRAGSVLWRRTTGGVVALGSNATDPVMITGAGVLIWELLEDPIPPDELVETLGAIHDMPVADVLEQITPVVDELLRLGVLETCP
jgi:hypothetical protein